MTEKSRGDILLIDDKVENLKVLCSILNQEGYKVHPAISGELALKTVHKIKPDLILLDIVMPDVDGFTICKKIKEDPHTKDIPIIFFSVLDDSETILKAFKAGAVDYISKPFHDEEVLSRVETHVNLVRLRRKVVRRNKKLVKEIEKRKQIEEKLVLEKNRVQNFLNIAGVIIVSLDKNGNVILINKRGYKLLGYTEEEVVGKNWFDLVIPEENRENIKNVFDQIIEGHGDAVEYYENAIVTKNNIYRIIEWHNTIIKDEFGNICGTLSSGNDITDRKNIEIALNNARREWEEIFQAIGHPTLILSKEHTVLQANRSCLNSLGISSPFEIYGKRCYELFHKSSTVIENCPLCNLIESGTSETVEMTMEALHGKFLVSCTPIYDDNGALTKIIHIATDITDRIIAEEALRESEERFRRLAENAKDVIHRMSLPDFEIEYISPACHDILGYTPEDFYQDKNLYMNIMLPEWRNFFISEWKKFTKGSYELPSYYEFIIVHKDGSERWLSQRNSIVFNEHSEAIAIEGITTDITQKKRAELERITLNNQLLEKNKELEQLIYATSHDLRSPLVNIQGFTSQLESQVNRVYESIDKMTGNDVLKDEAIKIVKNEMAHSLDFILSSSSKMNSLLNGLLNFLKIGCYQFNFTRIDMKKLLNDVLTSFEFKVKEKQINIEVNELPPCTGDPVHLNQVFTNLIDNAIKYFEPDQEAIIRIHGDQKEDCIRYEIEDNGIGIPDGNLKDIFQIFYRVDPKKTDGLGLGLNIAHKIINMHNGKIWVESKVGDGSKFIIELPNRI